jgi:hypothetical protein
MLHVMNRVAAACAESGEHGEARALAEAVVEGAAAAGDEPLRIEGLRLLAALAPAEWGATLAEAEEATEYARYRRGGAASSSTAVQGLFELLRELFAD